jgi:acetylornithine deacetylase
MSNPSSPVAELLFQLVATDSTNPELVPGGAGEGEVVRFLAQRLSDTPLTVETWDVRTGRPNLVARLHGSGGGRSLIVCGHTDVVGAEPAGFRPRIDDGRLYGRGALDMKGGLAAAVIAAERIAQSGPLRGDLILGFVIDEEWLSEGAEALAERCRADGAIFPEPTNLDVVTSHGGFAWYDVVSRGVPAAGIEPELGVDAISLLAPFLAGITEIDRALVATESEQWGRGSIHASTIGGGEMYPSYPAECRLGVERCLVPGELVADADDEMIRLIAAATGADERFDATWRRIIGREPVVLDPDEPVVEAVIDAAQAELGRIVTPRFDIGWLDSGVLNEAGIPSVVFGPAGHGEHTAEEWVDIDSLDTCARVLESTIRRFCG